MTIASNAVKGLDLLGNLTATAGASTLGVTVMRSHIYLGFQWPTPTGNDFFCVGVLVCRDTDITNGIDPNTNPGDDWMLARQVFPVATGATIDANTTFEIDLRSKRKMDELEQRCGLMLSNHSAASRTVSIYARTLVALP